MFQSLLCWIGRVNGFGCREIRRDDRRFNPCCVGLAASTSTTTGRAAWVKRFQSLLCWIGRVNWTFAVVPFDSAGFQSLLCWIGRVNRGHGVRRRGPRSSFNPCCVGLAASTPTGQDRTVMNTCFNPCCVGLAASTSRNIPDRPRGQTFQSLLCWIGRVNIRDLEDPLLDAIDVSILVVLDWPRQPRPGNRTSSGSGTSFNPCCVGLAASTPFHAAGRSRRVSVSILVVLDWPRQRPRKSSPGYASASFNPCCVGLAASTTATSSSTCPCGCFNPCCVGLAASTMADPGLLRVRVGVSILVVLDWPRQPPCHHRGRGRHRGVSILVVLDWPRQPWSSFTLPAASSRFQSLLCWIGRVNPAKIRNGWNGSTVFQSLLCWIGRVNPSGPVSYNHR